MDNNEHAQRIKLMSTVNKSKLTAIWMGKERSNEMKTIDFLFYLDDEWKAVYEKHKNKSFTAAQLTANEHILNLIYQ